MKKRFLITGASGQLGSAVRRALDGAICACPSSAVLDIRNQKQMESYTRDFAPDVVIHCAAYTDVDRAEQYPDEAESVNAVGTAFLAKICRQQKAKMVYVSTDYVFSGHASTPYEVDSLTAPINNYGRTKLAGEIAVRQVLDEYFILRTSWLFGLHGDNFVEKMLRVAEQKSVVEVVCDQMGSPTYAEDLAAKILEICAGNRYGTYHITNAGVCTRAEFAREIFRQAGCMVKVVEVPSEAFPMAAKRPRYTVLSGRSLDKGGFGRLPGWESALSRYLSARAVFRKSLYDAEVSAL